MTNHILQNSKENPSVAKRKRGLAAVAQEIVTSEDDDNVADGMDICNIIENQTDQHRQTATSCALHALGETIKNTLLEINEIREQNRERRHRELLQILKKMVQQENTTRSEPIISKVTNLSDEDLNHDQHLQTKYVVEHDFLEKDFCNSDELANTSSSPTFLNNLDQSNANFATLANNASSTCIKLLHKSQINKEQLIKVKNGFAVKHDDTKKELQKMRAQMLELQRQKMEDRERKKREFIQMKNM